MLNQLGNGRWLLSGASMEQWQTIPELFAVGKIRLIGEQEFVIQNAWLIVDDGSYRGGIVAHIADGELSQTWHFTKDRTETEGIPRIVLDSALETFHYLDCRGRQYGCSCAND